MRCDALVPKVYVCVMNSATMTVSGFNLVLTVIVFYGRGVPRTGSIVYAMAVPRICSEQVQMRTTGPCTASVRQYTVALLGIELWAVAALVTPVVYRTASLSREEAVSETRGMRSPLQEVLWVMCSTRCVSIQ